MPPQWVKGSELPDWTFTWRDRLAAIIDFSTGWTFTLKLGVPGSAAVFTKTASIVGAATDPNVTASFAAAELDAVPKGVYQVQVVARRTSDAKDRTLTSSVTILDAVT